MRCIKLLSLSFILVISILSKAQKNSEYNYISFSYNKKNTDDKPFVNSMKGKTVLYEVINTKKNKREKFQKTFNERGYLSEFYQLQNDEKTPLQLSTFNDSGLIVNNKVYNKNGLKEEVVINRMNYKAINELIKLKKGKEKSRKVFHYRASEPDCDSVSYWYKKGKLKRKWIHEYYDKCERKKTLLQNSDGKTLKEWSYDCKSEGELVEHKKNVTQVCKWEEVDDKYIMYIRQSIKDNGKTVKGVFKHRRSDTAIVSITYYDSKNRKESYTLYDPDIKYRRIKSEFYKNNGEVSWSEEFTYESNVLKSSVEKSGRWFNKVDYQYDSLGLLKKLTFHIKKEGNIYRETILSYS